MIDFNSNLVLQINSSFIKLNIKGNVNDLDIILITTDGNTVVSILNDNFTKFDVIAPSVNNIFYVGMQGKELLSFFNENIQTKSDIISETYPIVDVLINTDTLLLYDAFDVTTIEKNEAGVVSSVKDKFLSGNDLVSGSCIWDSSRGLTFNGSSDYLKSSFWENSSQPYSIYIFGRVNNFIQDALIFDGFNSNGCSLAERLASNTGNYLEASAGTVSGVLNGFARHEWGLIKIKFDGENSSIKVNDNVAINNAYDGGRFWNCGSRIINGITLGASNALDNFSDIDIQSILIFNQVISDEYDIIINKYYKDNYFSKYRFDKGYVIMTYDGDFNGIITGHNIAHAAGLSKQELYVCTTAMPEGHTNGNVGGVLGWEDVIDMNEEGMSVQNHSIDHVSFLTKTEQQLIDDVVAVKSAIQAHGLPEPRTLAYPYGYTNEFIQSVMSNYFDLCRGVVERQILGTSTNKYNLPGILLDAFTETPEGIQKIKDQIDYAIQNKTVLILYAHGIGYGYPQSSATFTELMEYISNSEIEVIDTADLYLLLD